VVIAWTSNKQCEFPKIAANNSIQINSILYYLCAESTATRPITDTTECSYKKVLEENHDKAEKQTNDLRGKKV
jgi:hypothetical protein